jgi:uncharacterized protein (TIGR00255 family)
MAKSMTAFGREEIRDSLGYLAWEIRSVNHRYQEISMRLPEELRSAEPDFRRAIANAIQRGRVDAILHYQGAEPISGGASLNQTEIRRLAQWETEVHQIMPDAPSLRTAEILRWPGVLGAETVNIDHLYDQAFGLLEKTVAVLLSNRKREGKKLSELLQGCLSSARDLVRQTKTNWPTIEADLKSRLEERIADLETRLDSGRLEQEVVLLLSKADIREEIDRLLLHFDETERVLAMDGAIGRRLDFLMQELNREANTMAAKSAHPKTTTSSVDLKVLIEQMREQVQNVE